MDKMTGQMSELQKSKNHSAVAIDDNQSQNHWTLRAAAVCQHGSHCGRFTVGDNWQVNISRLRQ